MVQQIIVYAIGIGVAVLLLYRILRPLLSGSNGKKSGGICSCCPHSSSCSAKNINGRYSRSAAKEDCGYSDV